MAVLHIDNLGVQLEGSHMVDPYTATTSAVFLFNLCFQSHFEAWVCKYLVSYLRGTYLAQELFYKSSIVVLHSIKYENEALRELVEF